MTFLYCSLSLLAGAAAGWKMREWYVHRRANQRIAELYRWHDEVTGGLDEEAVQAWQMSPLDVVLTVPVREEEG